MKPVEKQISAGGIAQGAYARLHINCPSIAFGIKDKIENFYSFFDMRGAIFSQVKMSK